jgi:mannose-6-phosphate isomerase-like protein (cupin superfamily)
MNAKRLLMSHETFDTVRVIDGAVDCPALPIVAGAGTATAVIWPGVGAEQRSMHSIRLERDASTVVLSHPSDCVYYVIQGAGVIVDGATGAVQPLCEGAMVHIDAGDSYLLRADGDAMSVVGGPCPPDPAFYAHIEGS